jgi:HlyD family secretion protein
MQRTLRMALVALAVLALGVGVAMWRRGGEQAAAANLRTVPVKHADLLATIGATGTVEPEEVVDVGAQVAGQINSFGKDASGKTIDYGSVVDEGTVLAQIDDSLYAADVEASEAQVEQARAGIVRANADLAQMKAKLNQAQRDWDRAQKLGPSEALAPSAYDQYKANYEVAQANVAVSESAITQAKATLLQTQAALDRAQRNLSYCTIKSPVKGVIIDRRVNIGQTVVSSLNAPSLFLIAKDLRRIQVWVSVNEADIGNIHPGQTVTFTVDAFPNHTFHGQVGKVRLNATMTQNVVTYTVEVTTDNSDGRLLPYLTANAQFEVGRRQNVLVVPNAALRWWPQPKQIPAEYRDLKVPAGGDGQATGIVWIEQDHVLRPIVVTTGLTDGSLTEIQGGDLAEGMAVVVGEQASSRAGGAGGSVSPFAPQPLRGH